jgi:hypothetical protein
VSSHSDRIKGPDGSFVPSTVQVGLLSSVILSPVISPASIESSDRGFGPPWVTCDIGKAIPTARVLVYNHGEPEDGCDINSLAQKLLDHIMSERTEEKTKRPLFFVTHSTGGLIVKAVLIIAQESQYTSIGHNCYGVTFFATPHQGSSYLSSPLFDNSISRAMGLIWPIPSSLQMQLTIHHPTLRAMAKRFMPVAAELDVWTFYEAVDTNLTDPNATEAEAIAFSAPNHLHQVCSLGTASRS